MRVEALSQLVADPARAALFFDVDGVLAPIVPRPEDARVPEATRRELRRLAAAYGLVACVTGRASAVAREIVGVRELRYAGEHGLELEPKAAAFAGRIHAFARDSGWHDVELKPFSATLHYRTSPEPDRARERLEAVARAAEEEGLRARFGRLVLEILPPVEASKGTAVARLLEESRLRRALYAGDDTTDLDGFAALAGLDVALRIAVASEEGPRALVERADVVVASPAELLELLRRL